MNYVEQITSSMITEAQTALGGDYKELCYFYDLEKNGFNSNAKRFGVIPVEAKSVLTVAKAYTLDHSFQLIVTDNYFNKEDGDISQREVANQIYDKVDEVTARIYASKVGIPSIVFFVSLDSISEPEFLEDDNVVAIRANYIIKYRRNI